MGTFEGFSGVAGPFSAKFRPKNIRINIIFKFLDYLECSLVYEARGKVRETSLESN